MAQCKERIRSNFILSFAEGGHFGQIPAGRQNGFHLRQKYPWKGNKPSRREFLPDMFAILTPRRRG